MALRPHLFYGVSLEAVRHNEGGAMTSHNNRSDDADEIRDLIGRLSHLSDHGLLSELDEYANCFTEDGIFEMPTETRRGRDDIRAGSKERRTDSGPEVQTRHLVGSISIDFDGDDDATAESNFLFGGPGPDGKAAVLLIGHYTDWFRRTPDGWKFAHRKISFT